MVLPVGPEVETRQREAEGIDLSNERIDVDFGDRLGVVRTEILGE